MWMLLAYLVSGLVVAEVMRPSLRGSRNVTYFLLLFAWPAMLFVALVRVSLRRPQDNHIQGVTVVASDGDLPEHQLVQVNLDLWLIVVDNEIVGACYRRGDQWRAADKTRISWKFPQHDLAAWALLQTQMMEAGCGD